MVVYGVAVDGAAIYGTTLNGTLVYGAATTYRIPVYETTTDGVCGTTANRSPNFH